MTAASAASAQTSGETSSAPIELPSGALGFPAGFFADASPSTALDMVRRVPGFVMIDTDPDVRGLSGATGNVLVDGQLPPVKSVSLSNYLQRIPAGTIERIDLIRGSAPGIDMQGQPVVVNIIRRGGAYSTFAVQSFIKAYPDGDAGPMTRIEASRRSDTLSLEAAVSARNERMQPDSGEGAYSVRTTSGAPVEEGRFATDYWTREVEASLAAEMAAGDQVFRLNAAFASTKNDRNETYDIVQSATGPAVERNVIDVETNGGELSAAWELPLGRGWNSEFLVVSTYERDAESAAQMGRKPTDFSREVSVASETVGWGTATYEADGGFKLELTAEGAFNSLDVSSERSSGGVPVALPAANVLVEETRGEAGVLGSWSPRAGLDLELSGRFETSTISLSGDVQQEKSLSFFKPRLMAAWEVASGLQLRLRLEREVGQLDFEDFAASSDASEGLVSAGNPDLEPELANVVELAMERRFWGRGALVLAYRHDEVEQVVDLIPVDGRFDAPGNIGDGTRDELKLSLTVPLDRFGVSGGLLQVNGAQRWSSVVDPVTGQERRISGERPFEGDFLLARDVPAWKSSFVLEGDLPYSERSFRLRQIQSLDQGGWWKVYWDYQPRPDMVIRFQLENFTSRERTRTREIYGAARSLTDIGVIERRSAAFDPFFLIRVRKTF